MLTFSVKKLSYTQDLAPDAPPQNFQWGHLTDNLMVVFDSFRSSTTAAETMKVLQATRVVHDIPIQRLIDQGKTIIRTQAQHGIEVSFEQLPIAAIIKSPVLALRYALEGQGKVRRIQIKFASQQDYDTAVYHLRELGLSMTAAKPSASKPSSPLARPQSGGPSCPPSQLSELSNRPVTAVSPSTPSIRAQLRDAAAARPHSAQPAHDNPLVPPVFFPRPNSAISTILAMNSYSPALSSPGSWSSSPSFSGPSVSTGSSAASELPPRRELPFDRPDSPRSRGSDVVRSSSRPSSVMGPPPLPLVSRSVGDRPSSKAGLDIPPLPMPTILGNLQTRPHTSPASRITQNRSIAKPSGLASRTPNMQENRATSSPLHSPLATRDTPARRSPINPTSASEQNEFQSRPKGSFAVSPTSETIRENSPNSMGHGHLDVDVRGLADFAAQSDDVRTEALNSFLLRHIDDDNFLTLVEDVEASWVGLVCGRR